ncbi:hypothetical protein HZA96_03300 [Candidatus Woesearchaeota archaeon]|nr:hypothetical protein [Candidatus Woesearchaeota archaeon]
MKINLKNLLFASFVIFLVAFLLGFTVSFLENDAQTASITSLPINQETKSYTVYNNGYPMDAYVIEKDLSPLLKEQELKNKILSDEKMYQNFKKSMQIKNSEDAIEDEEERIKDYCKDVGYWKCLKIKESCDEDQCYPVKIKCTDASFDAKWLDPNDPNPDNECDSYDVDVIE